MALALYAATAIFLLWLAHKCIHPLSRAAAVFLFLVPFALAGGAMIRNEAIGPIDAIYMGEPLNAIRLQRGVGPPHNLVTTDIYTQMYPWRHVVRESYRRGEWPLWNPYILSGDILAAAAQPAAYDPFTLLACILPAPLSFTFAVAMAFLIAAIGAFALARDLGCRESAAAIASVGWAYCSAMALYSIWPLGFCWAYLPLVLLSTRRVVHEPGVKAWAFLTTTLTLVILAGHPESVMHIVTLGVVYALFEMLQSPRPATRGEGQGEGPLTPSLSPQAGRGAVRRAIPTAFAAGITALLLSAIYLLPFLEAVPQTAEHPWRKILSKADIFETAIEVKVSLLTNFFPFLHIRRWIEPGPAGLKAETAIVGSVILALAIYAIWRVRSRQTWFFTGMVVVCLLVHSSWKPIAKVLRHVPGYDITINTRLGFGAAFAFALLAALGVEEILRRKDRRAAAMTLTVILVLLTAGTIWINRSFVIEPYGNWGSYREFAELFFLGLAALLILSRIPLRIVAPALVLVIAAQRVMSEGGVHKSFPMSVAYPPMRIFEPMREVREPFRVVGHGFALIPGMSAFYGLEDIRGYEAMTFDPLYRTYPLWCVRQSFYFNQVEDISRPFITLMNVRFAIAGEWLPAPYGWRLVAQQGHVILLENMNAMERAFIPRNVKLGPDEKAALEEMKVTGDFRERAWITSDQPMERANGPGTLRIRRTGTSEYVIDADMEGDGWIVLTNSAWKGWRAYVDGRRVKTQRANLAFLSVYVPKGKHTIRFVYWPESFVIGRGITFATLLGIVVFGIVRRRKSRSRREPL